MTDELVQRLRIADADTKAIFGEDFVSTQGEAADEIERLRAEIAHVKALYKDCDGCLGRAIAERDTAESALAALRKRVEDAPTGHWTYIGGGEEGDYGIVTDDHNTINQFEGKRVALVVLDY